MDAEEAESFETLYDQLEVARRDRDAAGRLCARAVIANDMDGAQWQAASFQSYADRVDSLRDQIIEGAADRK